MTASSQERYGTGPVADSPMPAAYIRVLLRIFAEHERETNALLAGTDIASTRLPDANATIRLRQFLRFIDNLTRFDPDWGINVNVVSYASAHGTVGLACLTAPTIGDALEVLERHAHLRAPYFRLTRTERENFATLTVEPQVELDSESRRPLLESLLLSLQGIVEGALQRPIREGAFNIAGAPTPHASRYDSFFHAPVHFRASASAIAIPREWLALSCPLADPEQHMAAIDELLSLERHFRRDGGIVRDIERILQDHGEGLPSLASVAKSLDVSRRTLARRLTESGTSYRALAQEHRRRRAVQLLRDETLTVGEIADRLGYSDPANFGRACHRWFAMSPREYRERLP
ncbi:MAG: AraC family transcriptional regulator ligand-binding domain-containing protein [Polyangiales bacterium]